MERVVIAILSMLGLLLLPGCKTIRLISLYKSAKQQVTQTVIGDPIDIPFSYQRDWIMLHLLVKQGTDSVEGAFIFDSGAFTSLFDSCQPIRVWTPPNVARLPVQGALGKSYKEMKIARNISLQAGQFAVLKPKLLVSAKPHFFPAACLGIIGADFFRGSVLTIDFKHQRFRLEAAGRFNAVGMTTLKMKTVANSNPVLQKVSLGDLPTMDYLLDAGNVGSVLIQQPDQNRLRAMMGAGLREYAIKEKELKDGSGTRVASNYYTKTERTIGLVQCPEFEVAGLINGNSPPKFGNMGLAFLKQVFESITLDFSQRQLYYKINPHPISTERMDREVYFSQEDSSFFTGPVLMHSVWYEQGLKPGMQVIHINGQDPVVYMNQRREGKEPGLRSVTLSTGDGKSHTITK